MDTVTVIVPFLVIPPHKKSEKTNLIWSISIPLFPTLNSNLPKSEGPAHFPDIGLLLSDNINGGIQGILYFALLSLAEFKLLALTIIIIKKHTNTNRTFINLFIFPPLYDKIALPPFICLIVMTKA